MTDDDRTSNINLVCEVRKYECLYNFSTEDYCNRQVVEKAWSEIGEKLGISGATAKTRWGNLRTVYVRRRKRIQKSKSGSQKPYYLNKYMQFLIPHLKSKPGIETTLRNSLQQQEVLYISNSPAEQHQHVIVDNGEDKMEEEVDEVTDFEVDANIDEENLEFLTRKSNFGKISPSLKLKNDIDKAFVKYTQTKEKAVGALSDDARKMFLLSLLPEVNEFSESEFKIFKRRVFVLIDNIEAARSMIDGTGIGAEISEASGYLQNIKYE